jgi:uncharacterized ferredoxin-like protein
MPIIDAGEAEGEGLLRVAELMAIAARTAPKTRGVDEVVTAIVKGEDKDAVADEMAKHYKGKRNPLSFFERDAENLRRSPLLLLLGVRGTMPKKPENPLNCGACGFETCADFIGAKKRRGEDFTGPICVWHAVDLGIALGSAAKALSLIEADVIVGIPISATGKNIYFDRG